MQLLWYYYSISFLLVEVRWSHLSSWDAWLDFFYADFAFRLVWLDVVLLGMSWGGLSILHCLVLSFKNRKIWFIFFAFIFFITIKQGSHKQLLQLHCQGWSRIHHHYSQWKWSIDSDRTYPMNYSQNDHFAKAFVQPYKVRQSNPDHTYSWIILWTLR